MFDFVAEPLAAMLAFFYAIIPNYAIAIFFLTVVIMLVLTPLTLKSTRSMTAMQELQPEIKALQAKHRGDRQKLNEEMLKLYQERGVNPLGGCLPMLVQLPFFFAIFTVIQGLTYTGPDGTFQPKYVSPDTALYKSLDGQTEMVSFGIDLARSANEVLKDSFVDALPYLFLVALTALFAWLQQRQLARRRRDSGAPALPAQQQVIMKVLPYVGVFFAFFFPAALVIYWVTSSLWRIGQQAYINRTVSARPASAVVDVTEVPDHKAGDSGTDGQGAERSLEAPPRTSKRTNPAAGKPADKASSGSTTSPGSGSASSRRPPPGRRTTGGNGSNGARRSTSRKGKTEDKGPTPSRRTGGANPPARRRRKKR
jgi:YidC/Oxa1 family membrane protein insertase